MLFDNKLLIYMKKKTKTILSILTVLAYMAMVGYAIKAGSQIVTFGVSFYNPEAAKNIPGSHLAVHDLYQIDRQYYIHAISFVITLSCLHVYLWYCVIQLLSKLNLQNPFSWSVEKILENTAYQLLGIWVIGFIGKSWIDWIGKHTGLTIGNLQTADEYLFFAGIVYIISQVFRRGIEVQEENELTV
jgi:hypothetical protein